MSRNQIAVIRENMRLSKNRPLKSVFSKRGIIMAVIFNRDGGSRVLLKKRGAGMISAVPNGADVLRHDFRLVLNLIDTG